MEREVLFRGKRIDTKKWVEGYYVNKSTEKHQIVTQKDTFPILVIPETVCEFLFTANGHRFFEDCIIKRDKSNQLWVIIWNDLTKNFSCLTSIEYNSSLNHDYRDWILTNHSPVNYNWIVKNGFYSVGSIHDNPELLKS